MSRLLLALLVAVSFATSAHAHGNSHKGGLDPKQVAADTAKEYFGKDF